MSYLCQYRKYYNDSRRDVWCKIPMSEGYAEIAGAMSLDGWLSFSGAVMQDGAYLGEEVRRMIKKS